MIRVVIVDDSATMRALLAQMIGREPDMEVVGTARDAHEARTMIRALDPDVVTLDIEMPEMNGLDFLERIMRLRPTPVIIVSTLTQKGADVTAHALRLGAVDCYAKPTGQSALGNDEGRLAGMIREASTVRFSRLVGGAAKAETTRRAISASDVRLVAIGSSTGGVEALHVVLGSFPQDCPPTLVVQHINPQFAPAVAKRLDQECAPRVLLAEPDLPLRRGHVYLAPGGDRHLQVSGGTMLAAKLRSGEKVSGHRPSVDVLFHSVAAALPGASVGVLLTGMGQDGAQGLLAMREAGCLTIAQDEATCTVYGMPRAAVDLGAADLVLPLGRISERVLAGAAR